MPVVPCVRPSQGSVTKPANGMSPRAAQLLGRGLHQQPDLPVAGVVAERERRAVRLADAALRAEDQDLRAPELRRAASPCRRPASSRRDRRSASASRSAGVIGSGSVRSRLRAVTTSKSSGVAGIEERIGIARSSGNALAAGRGLSARYVASNAELFRHRPMNTNAARRLRRCSRSLSLVSAAVCNSGADVATRQNRQRDYSAVIDGLPVARGLSLGFGADAGPATWRDVGPRSRRRGA